MTGGFNTSRVSKLHAFVVSSACLLACGQEANLGSPKPSNTNAEEERERDAAADETATSSASDDTSTPNVEPVPAGGCSTVRREALGQVDATTSAEVLILEEGAAGTLLYVDASAGGFQGSATNPYVYVKLDGGSKVTLSDFQADESAEWDLAFKRFTIRTNSADSGPGGGGAVGLLASFGEVLLDRVDTTEILTDDFIDDATCDIASGDDVGGVWTPFSGWYDYDDTNMTLSPAAATYVVRGANGQAYYKLEILDYYATPQGAQGQVSGRYLVRYMQL